MIVVQAILALLQPVIEAFLSKTSLEEDFPNNDRRQDLTAKKCIWFFGSILNTIVTIPFRKNWQKSGDCRYRVAAVPSTGHNSEKSIIALVHALSLYGIET